MNIKLEIGEDVLKYLKEDNIPMNIAGSVMMILMALYHDNYTFLEYLDDRNKEKQVMLLYQLLYRKDYIEETQGEEMEEALYKLTKKGENFIKYAESSSVIVTPSIPQMETWIDEYINLFPEHVRGQRNLRGDRDACITRMNWFMKKYKQWDSNHILAATEEYINSQAASEEGHKYTVTSDYFIKKGIGVDMISRLAQACEEYDPNNLTQKQDLSRDTI